MSASLFLCAYETHSNELGIIRNVFEHTFGMEHLHFVNTLFCI